MKTADLIGRRFGRLLVVRYAGSIKGKGTWECVCDCGKLSTPKTGSLNSGLTNSCGCLREDTIRSLRLTHGESRNISGEYSTWKAMKNRCGNPACPKFHYYGGLGITVCERWAKSFENFLADMGRKPTLKHSIDRYPDNTGNYEPGNCRWATQKQQVHNRRNVIFLAA